MPTSLLWDDESHWAAAGRLYALVADTDVTLTYHFTHLYNDAFRHKSRVGLSLSRTFGPTEVHAEASVDPAVAVRLPALDAEWVEVRREPRGPFDFVGYERATVRRAERESQARRT